MDAPSNAERATPPLSDQLKDDIRRITVLLEDMEERLVVMRFIDNNPPQLSEPDQYTVAEVTIEPDEEPVDGNIWINPLDRVTSGFIVITRDLVGEPLIYRQEEGQVLLQDSEGKLIPSVSPLFGTSREEAIYWFEKTRPLKDGATEIQTAPQFDRDGHRHEHSEEFLDELDGVKSFISTLKVHLERLKKLEAHPPQLSDPDNFVVVKIQVAVDEEDLDSASYVWSDPLDRAKSGYVVAPKAFADRQLTYQMYALDPPTLRDENGINILPGSGIGLFGSNPEEAIDWFESWRLDRAKLARLRAQKAASQ